MGQKNVWKFVPLRGGGAGPLMANAILNFHFDYPHPSLRLNMDQKGHIRDQKGLKIYEKRQKMGFSDLKYQLFSRIFLSGKSSCPKPLAEMGGTPPTPLRRKFAK